MEWSELYSWFMSLGEPYGVNPVIFGSIYVGAIPIFWLAIVWLVQNVRNHRPVTAPVFLACGCAISSYVYLIVAGENVPLWVYGVIVAVIIYAIYSTLNKVKQKKKELLNETSV